MLRFLRRTTTAGQVGIWKPHPAPRQRLAQQAFDLGIDASEIGRGGAFHRREQTGVEPQGKGFALRHYW